MKITGSLCEICKEKAFVYCWADSAFLCWNCDYKVHQANFLVARHLRHVLCTVCNSFCQSQCSTLSSSSSSSSDCVSTTNESSSSDFNPKRVFVKSKTKSRSTQVSDSNTFEEGIFAVWCKELGVNRHCVVPTATSALRFCLERLAVLPFRLSLPAAFWIGLRMSGAATRQNLRRLEELCGVAAKLIVAMEPRVARAMRLRRRGITQEQKQDLEEGWAECNV